MRRNLHSTVASQPERAVKAPDARELSAWVHEDGLKYGSGLFKLIRAVGMLEVRRKSQSCRDRRSCGVMVSQTRHSGRIERLRSSHAKRVVLGGSENAQERAKSEPKAAEPDRQA